MCSLHQCRLIVGKRKKKNRNLGPRRKRMRRPARLQAALKWRSGYGGKNIVRGYARWFGVDLLCAIVELRMLGVAVDAEYEQLIRRTITARAEARARWRAAKLAEKNRSIEVEWPDDWPMEWIPTQDASNEVVAIDECPSKLCDALAQLDYEDVKERAHQPGANHEPKPGKPTLPWRSEPP